MLLPMQTLQEAYDVRPRAVLHLGAHLAEEAPDYQAAGVKRVLWVEANLRLMPTLHDAISAYPGHRAVCAAVSDHDGADAQLHLTNETMCSSLLPLGDHAREYPSIVVEEVVPVTTITVDTLCAGMRPFDFVNLDLQGGELAALRGMPYTLAAVRWLYTEVNWAPMYTGCGLIDELDEWLALHQFLRVATRNTGRGWGDALYTRQEQPHG